MIHLLPCAGKGSRFLEKGYKEPKPLIDVNGQPMIISVLENIGYPVEPSEIDKYILIFRTEHLDHEVPKILSKRKDTIILSVDKVTEGAACTALLAKEYINNDEELWIGDCDHMIKDFAHIEQATKFFRKKDADGGLICHLQDHPKWSYTRVKDGKAIEVAEKRVISDLANTGDYYFKKGRYFVEAAERMIEKQDKTLGEFFICPVFATLIANNYNIYPYLVNQHIGLGTPEDLESYLKS
jgi:NDP-sugar pyrophosphorylase family protein